jgi:hypothetical protein
MYLCPWKFLCFSELLHKYVIYTYSELDFDADWQTSGPNYLAR